MNFNGYAIFDLENVLKCFVKIKVLLRLITNSK